MAASPKVAVITGATGQIGREIALGVAKAKKFDQVFLTCRDATRGQQLADDIAKLSGADVRPALVDLASVRSIKDFASSFGAQHRQVHLLINNAATTEQERKISTDGLEMQFAVNVQAYFSLMKAFAPMLASAEGGARVVNVASNYAGGLDHADLQFEKRPYDTTAAYKQSKQANRMLTGVAPAKLFGGAGGGGVLVNACHPGVVTSPLLKNLGLTSGFNSPVQGAATPLMLALDHAIARKTGLYFSDMKESKCPFMANSKSCEALWAVCDAVHEKA